MNIQAINAELAKIGYKAVKLPRKSTIANWKPQTQAGRTCKARMQMYERLPKGKGVTAWYKGKWCPSNHPADIAAYYADKWRTD